MLELNKNDRYDPLSFINGGEFDFDYWADLHKESPEEFEKQRAILMDTFIENSPEHRKRRSRGILFQINAVRRNSDTPLKNCMEISKMMWESTMRLQKAARSLALEKSLEETLEPTAQAEILEFKRRPQ